MRAFTADCPALFVKAQEGVFSAWNRLAIDRYFATLQQNRSVRITGNY
jgi:hypothetical protein